MHSGYDDRPGFDLNANPYETRNLAADLIHAELRRALEAEYENQSQAIGFRIPEVADVPPADGSLPSLTKSSRQNKTTMSKQNNS